MFPHLFHVGHVYLPTFGVLTAIGLMIALVLSERTAVLVGVDPATLWDAGIVAVILAFAVSRLLLVLTHWKTFVAFPVLLMAVPSLTATGLLLTGFATAAWLWYKRVSLLGAADAWAPCGALIWAFLALGHFAEGSDPGMPTGLPWGVRDGGMRVHPVALYVALAALLLALCSYTALKRGTRGVAGWTLAGAGLAQFVACFVRLPGAREPGGLDSLEWVAVAMMVAGTAAYAALLLDNGKRQRANTP